MSPFGSLQPLEFMIPSPEIQNHLVSNLLHKVHEHDVALKTTSSLLPLLLYMQKTMD